MQDIDKALFIRNQGLFKAELRDMRDEEIKMRLATRGWMEMGNRQELSWKEVLARTELERRQKRMPDLFQVITLEAELSNAQRKLKKARLSNIVATTLAVMLALIIVANISLSTGAPNDTEPSSAPEASGYLDGVGARIKEWFAR